MTATPCPYCSTPLAVYGSLLVCRNVDCVNLDEPMSKSDVENVPEREGMRAVERRMS